VAVVEQQGVLAYASIKGMVVPEVERQEFLVHVAVTIVVIDLQVQEVRKMRVVQVNQLQ
jgi:hypothetical protein